MSKSKLHRRKHDRPLSREAEVRASAVQEFRRRLELDRIGEAVLRAVFEECSVRRGLGGKWNLDFPSQMTLERAMKVASSLRRCTPEGRERVIRQLERIENIGTLIGVVLRAAATNPFYVLAEKSAFDRYLSLCQNDGVAEGIVRALHHLRDALTVTETIRYKEGTRTYSWTLDNTRITPAMLDRVTDCLRGVEFGAIHTPACNAWIKGIQSVLDQIKLGVFRFADCPGATPVEGLFRTIVVGMGLEVMQPPSTTSPPRTERAEERPDALRPWHSGLRALRGHLSEQYLDLSVDDFANLCRVDQEACEYAQRVGGAIERFCTHCMVAKWKDYSQGTATRAPEGEAWRQDDADELWKYWQRLTREATMFRRWLERELPQRQGSVGRRLVALAESTLVSGLFFAFLRKRFPELFRVLPDKHRDDSRRSEGADAARRTAILQGTAAALRQQRSLLPASVEKEPTPDVAEYCVEALAAMTSLIPFAAQFGEQALKELPCVVEKPMQRFVSAQDFCDDDAGRPRNRVELVEYEPGYFPPLRCCCLQRTEEDPAGYRKAEVCRFSLKGGAALSGRIATPVGMLFGAESRLTCAARFIGSQANRHFAEWPRIASLMAARQCPPCLESSEAQVVRIKVGAPAGPTLLILPTDALPPGTWQAGQVGITPGAGSADVAQDVTVSQKHQQSGKGVPAAGAVSHAAETHWRGMGSDPGTHSFCLLDLNEPAVGQHAEAAEDGREWKRRVNHFLNQKTRWPLEEAAEILNALGIVIEPKEDGAPHGKIRLDERHITLSSKLVRDKQVFATYLHEWIRELGQERLLADLLKRKDPRLAPYVRKRDAGEG